MLFLRQFGLIVLISFLGETLRYFLPWPVPASIYGLVLMLLALKFKVIPLGKVKDAGNFLIEIMPLMFIPPAVGLLVAWNDLREMFLPFILVVVLTTVLVMGITGRVTQWILRRSLTTEKGVKE